MNRFALAFSVLALSASAFFTTAPKAVADSPPSPSLLSVLNEIRALSDNDFRKLYRWGNSDPLFPPVAAPSQPDQTEEDILALDKPDRRALLAWLQGKGRSALYARGATDEEIGAKYRLISPAPVETPSGWRGVPITPGPWSRKVQGGTQILSSFVAVSTDGTSSIACVSFKNVARSVATRIVIDFLFLAANGEKLGEVILDRHGSFLPNSDVMGYASLAEFQRSGDPRSENCVLEQLSTPALPFLQARIAGYAVARAEYADGTVWPPGAPRATPSP